MHHHKPSLKALSCALIAFSYSFTLQAADSKKPEQAGSVALLSGKAKVRHGDIVGDKDAKNPEVRFHDNYEHELGPNDPILEGDVVITSPDTVLKIYYKDDSIMDVGPNTTFKVSSFKDPAKERKISFSMLLGKVRTLVTRKLTGSSSYHVSTPTAVMGVRGTEFVVHSYKQAEQFKTDITCLEGKVVVDVPKLDPSTGKTIVTPVTILPGKSFSGSGLNGAPIKFNVSKLSPAQMESKIALNPVTQVAGISKQFDQSRPEPSAMPATGVEQKRPAQQDRAPASAQPFGQPMVTGGVMPAGMMPPSDGLQAPSTLTTTTTTTQMMPTTQQLAGSTMLMPSAPTIAPVVAPKPINLLPPPPGSVGGGSVSGGGALLPPPPPPMLLPPPPTGTTSMPPPCGPPPMPPCP